MPIMTLQIPRCKGSKTGALRLPSAKKQEKWLCSICTHPPASPHQHITHMHIVNNVLSARHLSFSSHPSPSYIIIYDARLPTRGCRNPSTMNRPFIIVHYHVSAQTNFLPRGQPYGNERLAQTCFSLGLLGSLGQAQTSTAQTPNPKFSIIQPELSHLLPAA